jgi:AraC-like DNA-binding protein
MATGLAVSLTKQSPSVILGDADREHLPATVILDGGHQRATLPSLPAFGAGWSLQELMHQLLVDNLHRGLTLKDLSSFIGYSEKYCSEWFLAHMGRSFSSYVKQLRVERATSLLGSQRRLADIAEAVGFQDQYAFSHFFKKATGISPQGYRDRARLLGTALKHQPPLSSIQSLCRILNQVSV